MEISRFEFWDYFVFRKKIIEKVGRWVYLFKYPLVKVKTDDRTVMIWTLDGLNEDLCYIDKIIFIDNSIKISKMNIVKNAIKTLKYVYESKDEDSNKLLLYGFRKDDSNLVLKLDLTETLIPYANNEVTFHKFIKGIDDKLRCTIQNEVFFESSRTPLCVKDIVYEYNRSFFISDMAMFIKVKDIVVGYGQILILDNKYTIANLGILTKYQGKGYGRELLVHLINLAINKGLKEIYIRVKSSNDRALNLYKSLGFKEEDKINVYEIC